MRTLFILLLVCFSFVSTAQFRNTSHEFTVHLLNNKMYDEAILVLKEKLQSTTSRKSIDSLNFFLGKTYYTIQQLPQSIEYLDLVSAENFTLYTEAKFFSAFNEAYLKRFDQAALKLTSLQTQSEQWKQLKTFELAGTYLLKEDFKKFDSLQQHFAFGWPAIDQQQKNLMANRQDLQKVKRKSPLLAATFSAIIPGAGKFYAGRKGNAFYVLLFTGVLGAQTYEAYRKDGVESARFIIYSSLFTSFYIGNIWGSALAVKVVRNEKRDAIHHQVLFDMHIPLRTIFQ